MTYVMLFCYVVLSCSPDVCCEVGVLGKLTCWHACL